MEKGIREGHRQGWPVTTLIIPAALPCARSAGGQQGQAEFWIKKKEKKIK